MVCLLRLRTVSEACVFGSTNTLLAKIYHSFLNCQQICHAILVFTAPITVELDDSLSVCPSETYINTVTEIQVDTKLIEQLRNCIRRRSGIVHSVKQICSRSEPVRFVINKTP